MADYIAAGNVMVDTVIREDGSDSGINMGGPAFFALTGLKLWTDSCTLRSNVGADFYDYFGEWFQKNNVATDKIAVKADHCNHSIITYQPDGSYSGDSKYGVENMGYLKTTPEELLHYCAGAKGVYLAQNTDLVIWDKFFEVKKKLGFQMLWEIETIWALPENLKAIEKIAKGVDVFSLNLGEAAVMFSLSKDDENEIIERLKSWNVPLIYLRAGKRGAYTIAKGGHWFIPSVGLEESVDPTGCGNNSSGAILYAYCEGYDPIMCGIMAGISAYYNALQYGVYPLLTSEVRKKAMDLALKLRRQYAEV